MKFIRRLFFLLLLTLPNGAFAVSAGCMEYTNCDGRVACELYEELLNAQSGMAADYNTAAANAILSLPQCSGYADKFKRDISETIGTVKVEIKWDLVRQIIKNGNIAPTDPDMMSNAELTELIIKVLGPDTKAQEDFFRALATKYIAANRADNTARLDDAFVISFLGDGNNLEKYKTPLSQLTGHITEAELGIDVNWDDILTEVSNVMDVTLRKYSALVCENNRSYQGLIDAFGWILTAAAAVGTFYSGGAGGIAVATGRAALATGLKASARAIAKLGGKAAAKKLNRQSGKMFAKSAIKLGLKTNMRGWNNYAGKGVLRTGVKNYVKTAAKNLKNKWTALAATGALIYQGASSAGLGYSLLSSDADKEIVNCQDLDHNEGCYTVCGDSITGYKGQMDMLNAQVLKPVMGKTYCVNERDYHLYDTATNKKIVMDAAQIKKIKANMSKIQDKQPCDWNEDDIDMYIGFFIHDPDTLDISTEAMIIEDIIRIDD